MSNLLYQRLPDAVRDEFPELSPVDATNIGRLRTWTLRSLGTPPV